MWRLGGAFLYYIFYSKNPLYLRVQCQIALKESSRTISPPQRDHNFVQSNTTEQSQKWVRAVADNDMTV